MLNPRTIETLAPDLRRVSVDAKPIRRADGDGPRQGSSVRGTTGTVSEASQNASKYSCAHASQRTRENPRSRTPHARNLSATSGTTARHAPYVGAKRSSYTVCGPADRRGIPHQGRRTRSPGRSPADRPLLHRWHGGARQRHQPRDDHSARLDDLDRGPTARQHRSVVRREGPVSARGQQGALLRLIAIYSARR